MVGDKASRVGPGPGRGAPGAELTRVCATLLGCGGEAQGWGAAGAVLCPEKRLSGWRTRFPVSNPGDLRSI